jgi:hypothetical protein
LAVRRSYLEGDSDERSRMDSGQPVAVLEELLVPAGFRQVSEEP